MIPRKTTAGDSSSVGVSTRLPGLHSSTSDACLRLFAAGSIVWYHTDPERTADVLGGIALGIFLYLSFMHLGQHDNVWSAVTRRAKQLLIPWAAWWLFYAAISFWRARGLPSELELSNPVGTLLVWPAVHLWYLPFVFFGSLGVSLVRMMTTEISRHSEIVLALVVGLGLLPLLAFVPALPSPMGQMAYAIPTIGLGLAYGYCQGKSPRQQRWSFVAIAGLVAAACVPIWIWGEPIVAVAYTGSAFMMILYTVRLPRSRFLRRLGGLTLGIYLVHPFVMLVLLKFLGPDHPHWFYALMTFVLAALMTWSMRHIHRHARMII